MSVTITAKPLIVAKYAGSSVTTEYTCPASTKTIVDKFTANNTTGSGVTLAIYIVPTGESYGAQHAVYNATISANTCVDVSQLQNQVLTAGDIVRVTAGTASALVIRMSGREVVTA